MHMHAHGGSSGGGDGNSRERPGAAGGDVLKLPSVGPTFEPVRWTMAQVEALADDADANARMLMRTGMKGEGAAEKAGEYLTRAEKRSFRDAMQFAPGRQYGTYRMRF